jgi:hypothetical protein
MSLEMAHKVILPPKKNYIPQFLKQRDINSYFPLEIYDILSSSLKQSLKNPRKFCLLGTELAVYCIGAYAPPWSPSLQCFQYMLCNRA